MLAELRAVAALAADLARLSPAWPLIDARRRHADGCRARPLHQVPTLLLWVTDASATNHVQRLRSSMPWRSYLPPRVIGPIGGRVHTRIVIPVWLYSRTLSASSCRRVLEQHKM